LSSLLPNSIERNEEIENVEPNTTVTITNTTDPSDPYLSRMVLRKRSRKLPPPVPPTSRAPLSTQSMDSNPILSKKELSTSKLSVGTKNETSEHRPSGGKVGNNTKKMVWK